MNTFLIVLIAIKAVCLVVCWKGISIARKNAKNTLTNSEEKEFQALQKRMSELLEHNKQLNNEMNSLKDTKTKTGKL